MREQAARELAAAEGHTSPSTRCFNPATASTNSPSINVAFQVSGSFSVREATYFGLGLTLSAHSPVMGDQYAARP